MAPKKEYVRDGSIDEDASEITILCPRNACCDKPRGHRGACNSLRVVEEDDDEELVDEIVTEPPLPSPPASPPPSLPVLSFKELRAKCKEAGINASG